MSSLTGCVALSGMAIFETTDAGLCEGGAPEVMLQGVLGLSIDLLERELRVR